MTNSCGAHRCIQYWECECKWRPTCGYIKPWGEIETSQIESKTKQVSEWRREECARRCQQCLPVGSHFLHRSRAGPQPLRPSRNSPHNLPFIGGQSDAGSRPWLQCTDACVSACWRELLSPPSHSDGCLNVCGCHCVFAALPWQCLPPCGLWVIVSACHILTSLWQVMIQYFWGEGSSGNMLQ